METQLNFMWQKANVLKTLGQPLKDSLVAIAMVISLPPTYSTLQTILMAADDKLTTDAVINQVLIEEKLRKVSSTHSALTAKTTGQSKGKGKGKVSKEDKGKKLCTYCLKSGHTKDECWAKRAAECSKEKDSVSKEQADEKELAANVATMGSTHLPPLRLFKAQHTSIPVQRDWVVDSTASTQTMCHKRNLFDSHHPLQSPYLATLGNSKTISVPDTGDTLNWAPTPAIAGDSTLCETFTKKQAVSQKLQVLESKGRRDISNINHHAYNPKALNQRPAIASMNGHQASELQTNELDGESRRLATASTNSLNHLAINKINLNAEETKGLACGTVPQRVQTCSNSPGGMRAPTSTMESSDGLNTQAPVLKWQGDAVNESAKPSITSNQDRSRHQGNLTPKFEFGGETIRMEVRKDERQTNSDGLTYQRVPSQPLEPLTRNTPPTGKTDNLEGPACRRGRYTHRNDLGTCQNGRQRAVKEEKGQLDTKGIKDLPSPVKTDDDKRCNIARSPKAATESCDPSHMVNAHGLSVLYNVPGCGNLRSMAVSNKINDYPAHPFGKSDSPHDYNAIKTDNPPTPSTTNAHATTY